MKTKGVAAIVLSLIITAAGLSAELVGLVRFNFEHNTSETLHVLWAQSPSNYIGQPEIFGLVLSIWLVLIAANSLLSRVWRLSMRQYLGLSLVSTSAVLGVLWLDLFLLHSYLGFDNFQPDSSYWWVVGLVWLAHAGTAAGAIVIFRSSMKKDLAD